MTAARLDAQLDALIAESARLRRALPEVGHAAAVCELFAALAD